MTRALVGVLLAVSFAQSVFLAHAQVIDPDEGGYMMIGRLAVTGQIGLYDDQLPGHRTPLTYYVIGLSQVFGPSLLAARLTSAAVGTLALGMVYVLGGPLALLIAATHTTTLGYFANGSYHSLVALLLLCGLYALRRQWPVTTMACAVALFFVRPTFGVLIPIALVWLWRYIECHGRLLLVATVPVLLFFGWPSHVKLLAYVPVASIIAHHAGYLPVTPLPEGSWLGAARDAFRLFRGWMLLGAVAWMLGGSWRRLGAPGVVVIILLIVHVGLLSSPQWGVGYAVSFGLLVCIPLGRSLASAPTRILAVGLGAYLMLSPTFSRSLSLPLSVAWGHTVVDDLRAATSLVAARVPPDGRVFLFGPAHPLYLAGRQPYLRQVTHEYTESTEPSAEKRRVSGLWGNGEIHEWLERDATHALIVPESLAAISPHAALITRLLGEHFVVTDRFSVGPLHYVLYAR